MIGRKLSNFGVLRGVGPFLKSAHISEGGVVYYSVHDIV